MATKREALSNCTQDFILLENGRKIFGPHTVYRCMDVYHRHDPNPMHTQERFEIVRRPLIKAPSNLSISDETVFTTASRMGQFDSRYKDLQFIKKCLNEPANEQEKSIASRFCGVMAELTISEKLGGAYSRAFEINGPDQGWDIEIGGLKVDVKTSYWYKESWSVPRGKIKADALLFANVEIKPWRRVILRGWLEPSELVYCDRMKTMWRVPANKIRALKDFSI